MADFPGGIPDRADLDRVVPDRPVYLESRDGHTAWVNSKALELAGVTADTLDPADGRIERDADGRPSGALQEGAVDLVVRLLPADTPDELVAGLRLAQAELHALGVTNWQDASVIPGSGEVAYTTLAGRGELTARVVGALWWDRARGAEQIDELVERRARTAIGRYAPTSVKLFLDGVLENGTGAVLEPYLDDDGRPTANRGMSMIDPEALKAHVTRLDALGFQPHFHAIGERAVREALDAVEAARRANGPTDTRPHIAHIQVIHPDDIGRFRALGVIANAQPYWACHEAQMDELTIPRLGPERSGWQYPFALAPRRRRDPRDGLRLGRLDRRPAARDGGRGHPGQRRAPRRATAVPPRRAARADRRARRRSRPARPASTTSRARSARSRSARRRTWSCSIATCSTAERARSARPGWSPRSSTASRSTRRPRSRADGRRPRAWTHDDVDSAPHVGVAAARPGRCSCCATELIRGSGKETDQ